jgi:hypothetical protein
MPDVTDPKTVATKCSERAFFDARPPTSAR